MTQNPYAQFGSGPGGGQSPYAPDFTDLPQPRTSILAICSLVVAVVGCVVFCLPGPGALAMVLGGVAVLLIAFSSGRVRGIGFAATAICLGMLQSIVWFVALFGVYQPVMGFWNNSFVGTVNGVMTALEHNDTKTARSLLTKRGQSGITEIMLADFASKYQAKLGAFKGFPDNLYTVITNYKSIGPAMQAMQHGTGGGNQQNTIPLPGNFEKGQALIMLQMDKAGFTPGQPKKSPTAADFKMPVLNIGIVTNDGTEIWLMDMVKADALPVIRDSGSPPEKDAPEKPEPPSNPAPPANP